MQITEEAKCATPGLIWRSAIGMFITAATSRNRAPRSTRIIASVLRPLNSASLAPLQFGT